MGKTSTSGKPGTQRRSPGQAPSVLQWRNTDSGAVFLHRIGFKSPATISQAQITAQYDGTEGSLAARGRHDPCVVPRAVPIVEGMAAMVLMECVYLALNQFLIADHADVPINFLHP